MINTGIPDDIQKSLDNYAANPDSYSARNTVFQNLYKADPSTAANIAGQYAEGYNGLLSAIRQAYGLSDDEAAGIATISRLGTKGQQQAAQQDGQQVQGGGSGGGNGRSILPGNMLSILQRG